MGRQTRHLHLKRKSEAYFDSVALNNELISEPALCYGQVLDLLREVPGGTLADLGCGTGEMLQRILREFGDRFRLLGLDLSSESLKKAALLCGDRVTFTKGDVEALPYPDGSVYVLLCMHSFHHYPHPRLALREMYRVLAPGGRLILVENLHPPLRRIRKNLHLVLRRHPFGDIWMYPAFMLEYLVRRAGFRVQIHRPIADHSQLLDCRKSEASP